MSKEKSLVKTLYKTVILFMAANFVGAVAAYVKHSKKAEEHEEGNNLIHSAILGIHDMTIGAETEHSYITCFSGTLDITLEKPVHEDVFIDIIAALGKVTITLPMGVQCVLDDDGPYEATPDGEGNVEDENAPTVHITCKDILAKLEICYAEA